MTINKLKGKIIVSSQAMPNEPFYDEISMKSFIQAVINFLLTAIVLFTIFKVVSSFREAARKAAEKLQEAIHKDDEEEVVVEEAPVVEEVVVSEPTPSAEVVLLTEIRDLLSKKDTNE
jgi:large-conductance mechanosensitive channel